MTSRPFSRWLKTISITLFLSNSHFSLAEAGIVSSDVSDKTSFVLNTLLLSALISTDILASSDLLKISPVYKSSLFETIDDCIYHVEESDSDHLKAALASDSPCTLSITGIYELDSTTIITKRISSPNDFSGYFQATYSFDLLKKQSIYNSVAGLWELMPTNVMSSVSPSAVLLVTTQEGETSVHVTKDGGLDNLGVVARSTGHPEKLPAVTYERQPKTLSTVFYTASSITVVEAQQKQIDSSKESKVPEINTLSGKGKGKGKAKVLHPDQLVTAGRKHNAIKARSQGAQGGTQGSSTPKSTSAAGSGSGRDGDGSKKKPTAAPITIDGLEKLFTNYTRGKNSEARDKFIDAYKRSSVAIQTDFSTKHARNKSFMALHDQL